MGMRVPFNRRYFGADRHIRGDACVALASPMGGRWEVAGEQDAGRPLGRPYNGRFRGGMGAGIEVVVSLETERFGMSRTPWLSPRGL